MLFDDGCSHIDVYNVFCACIPRTGEVEVVRLGCPTVDGVVDGERQTHLRLGNEEEVATG